MNTAIIVQHNRPLFGVSVDADELTPEIGDIVEALADGSSLVKTGYYDVLLVVGDVDVRQLAARPGIMVAVYADALDHAINVK